MAPDTQCMVVNIPITSIVTYRSFEYEPTVGKLIEKTVSRLRGAIKQETIEKVIATFYVFHTRWMKKPIFTSTFSVIFTSCSNLLSPTLQKKCCSHDMLILIIIPNAPKKGISQSHVGGLIGLCHSHAMDHGEFTISKFSINKNPLHSTLYSSLTWKTFLIFL
jgi:hypothetical protein